MKKIGIIWLMGLLFMQFGFAQTGYFDKQGEVIYSMYANGGVRAGAGNTVMTYANGIARLVTDQSGKNVIPEVPQEETYLLYSSKKTCQRATFQNGELIHSLEDFNVLDGFEPDGTTEKILGYTCQKYVGSSFSNRIELWVTKDAGLLGTPIAFFPMTDGLVLKYVRNGNFGMVATQINIQKKEKEVDLFPTELGAEVTPVKYRLRLANAFVKDVSIFDKQQINWGTEINNPQGDCEDYTYRYAGGTVVLKKVNLPEVPDGTAVFAELKQQSNGDAYDRTGSVFVVPVDQKRSFLDGLKYGVDSLPKYISKAGKVYQGMTATGNYSPIVELVRFFTPFGIHHFNDKRDVGIAWEDTTTYKQEVTDLLPLLRGEAWIGVFIGNYDGGGHKMSLNLKYHLNNREVSKEPAKKYWIKPVFTTTNVLEMAGQEYGTLFGTDTLKVEFDVPAGVKNLRFRYLTTGHGGWGGGDEFVPKTNELFIDGQPFFQFTPWRTDCATYRAYNPASGNFWNGLSSSDYSRSGWCPGTVSNPLYMPVAGLGEGKHVIQVYIPQGEPEGNSFSAWNISGVFIGEIDE
ncbi:PNGase F N-terminal domain-containing protein [Gaoshiqia sediminis]|uniref:Peptide-N-glycosidase F-related protein n=1 Tax=Gaoshiqia sediminis TaxID=2986998 RepID=A0AA41Y432_9BACT|nr:PNGase F N-terminal domain-containing protein [Gaoshiqia sediminis]MCW0481136.1 peptide-N-glycosidase F-related protein [Gaoshiqia sediminis]